MYRILINFFIEEKAPKLFVRSREGGGNIREQLLFFVCFGREGGQTTKKCDFSVKFINGRPNEEYETMENVVKKGEENIGKCNAISKKDTVTELSIKILKNRPRPELSLVLTLSTLFLLYQRSIKKKNPKLPLS